MYEEVTLDLNKTSCEFKVCFVLYRTGYLLLNISELSGTLRHLKSSEMSFQKKVAD